MATASDRHDDLDDFGISGHDIHKHAGEASSVVQVKTNNGPWRSQRERKLTEKAQQNFEEEIEHRTKRICTAYEHWRSVHIL